MVRSIQQAMVFGTIWHSDYYPVPYELTSCFHKNRGNDARNRPHRHRRRREGVYYHSETVPKCMGVHVVRDRGIGVHAYYTAKNELVITTGTAY